MKPKPIQEETPLIKEDIDALSEVLNIPSLESGELHDTTKDIILLLGKVIGFDPKSDQNDFAEFRSLMSGKYSDIDIEKFVLILQSNNKSNIDKICNQLLELPEEKRVNILVALLEIAYAEGGYNKKQEKLIYDISERLNLKEKIKDIQTQFRINNQRSDKIVRSGTGIIVAIGVIVIFILTATFLKSVLFGLILAYFVLPLQRWYETKFFKNTIVCKVLRFGSTCISPLTKLSLMIQKNFSMNPPKVLSEDERIAKEEKTRCNRACIATILTTLVGSILLIAIAASILIPYTIKLGARTKSWVDKNVMQEIETKKSSDKTLRVEKEIKAEEIKALSENNEESGTVIIKDEDKDKKIDAKTYLKSLIAVVVKKIESLKPKLEKLPGFKLAKTTVSEYLQDEKHLENLISTILSKSEGVFSFTAGFLGNFFGVFFDILLTIFFFSFLLQKIASFRFRGNAEGSTPGDILIRGIFSTPWVPNASLETRNEAQKILNNIFLKLKTWVRGYLSIILIENILYTGAFLIIGVPTPYAIPLGMLAGCTVLLPFVGPLASAVLTILVCFAVGANPSMLMILAIVLTYVIITGLFDQFFLYPTFVGGALGLNTIETIIVVLLGALFAGLPGMIFAVPTASVLKYLIPQIYKCWE